MNASMKELDFCQERLRFQAEKCRSMLSRPNSIRHENSKKEPPVKLDVAVNTSNESDEFILSADLLQKELDDYKDMVKKSTKYIVRLQSEGITLQNEGKIIDSDSTTKKKRENKIFTTPMALNNSLKSTVSSNGGDSRSKNSEIIDSLDWVQVSDDEDEDDEEEEEKIGQGKNRSNLSFPGIEKSPPNSVRGHQKVAASSQLIVNHSGKLPVEKGETTRRSLSPTKSTIDWSSVTNRHNFIAQNKQNVVLLNHAMKVLTKEETSCSFVKATLRHAVLQEGPSLTPISVGSLVSSPQTLSTFSSPLQSPNPSISSMQSSTLFLPCVTCTNSIPVSTEEDIIYEPNQLSLAVDKNSHHIVTGIATIEDITAVDVLTISTSLTAEDAQSISTPPISSEPPQQTLPSIDSKEAERLNAYDKAKMNNNMSIKEKKATSKHSSKQKATKTLIDSNIKKTDLGKVSRHGKIDFILENKIEVKRTSDSVHYLRSAASLPPASHPLSSASSPPSSLPASSIIRKQQHQQQYEPHISPVLHRATLAAIKREISHDTRQQFLQLASSNTPSTVPLPQETIITNKEQPISPSASILSVPKKQSFAHNLSSSTLFDDYDVKKIQALAERTQSMFEMPQPPPRPIAVSTGNKTRANPFTVVDAAPAHIADTVSLSPIADNDLLLETINPMCAAAHSNALKELPLTSPHKGEVEPQTNLVGKDINYSESVTPLPFPKTHDIFTAEVQRCISRSMSRQQLDAQHAHTVASPSRRSFSLQHMQPDNFAK